MGTNDKGARTEMAGPSRVLVVDDEENIRDLVAMGLRYEGFIVEAQDGGHRSRPGRPIGLSLP